MKTESDKTIEKIYKELEKIPEEYRDKIDALLTDLVSDIDDDIESAEEDIRSDYDSEIDDLKQEIKDLENTVCELEENEEDHKRLFKIDSILDEQKIEVLSKIFNHCNIGEITQLEKDLNLVNKC